MAKHITIDENGNMVEMETADGGGSTTIQNNGVDLTQRSKLNFVGKQLIADNATNTSTDIQMFPNMPPDSYINQNVYPALEWVWKHTNGYWYYVTMVLSQASGNVGNTGRKFKVYKTLDWINHTEVCSYENISTSFGTPKIAIDSNNNIVVIAASAVAIRTVFFDYSNSYSPTFVSTIVENATNAVETTISLNVSDDNRFGVAFFQKHAGSTSYSQLMYVERSAGSDGTWGTPEILGDTPLRAATVTSSGAIQLFYTSTNEPIIAFLNNASATSSKAAIAKKVSGTWTVYDSTRTSIYASILFANNNVGFSDDDANYNLFTYSTNAFSQLALGVSYTKYITTDSGGNIYAAALHDAAAATAIKNIFYGKNGVFHRAIRPFFQIGAVISANAYSTFGIYTVIPYSRQRLTNAYHLVIRTDGAIFMEVI